MTNHYNYQELKEKALSPNATFEDKYNLLEWCEDYLTDNWNGEYYSLENNLILKPILHTDFEDVIHLTDIYIGY